MNNKKYFEINLQKHNLDFSSEFCLSESPIDSLLAEDLSGNKIILKKSKIYLYIHDATIENEYVKLFDNLEDFYSKTNFYDNTEQSNRYNKIVENYEEYDKDYIPDKKVLISTFIKKLGSNRLNSIYKDGSYYDVTMAFKDGNITREEFEIFRFLPQ